MSRFRKRQTAKYSGWRFQLETRQAIRKRHLKGKVAKGYHHGWPWRTERFDFQITDKESDKNDAIRAHSERLRESTNDRPPRISAPGAPAWEEARVKKEPKYPGVQWTTRQGEDLNIEDMDSGHLVNTLRACMRKLTLSMELAFIWAYWMNQGHPLWKECKTPQEQYSVYKNEIANMASLFYEMTWGRMSRDEEDAPWEEISAMMMECRERKLENWIHEWRCACHKCNKLRTRNKAFVAKHPDYKRM
jgi:hypothetical protein